VSSADVSQIKKKGKFQIEENRKQAGDLKS